MWGVFAQFKKNADAERENSAGLQADVYGGRKRSMDSSKRPAPMQ